MPQRQLYVMNRQLYEFMETFFKAMDTYHVAMPYYSITDNGQRVSLFWQREHVSISGELTNRGMELHFFKEDDYTFQKTWTPTQLKDAAVFIATFIPVE